MWRLAGLRYCAHMSVLVRLMGAFSVEVDGRIVDQGDFQHRSAAAVVKILALTPHRRMHREQVMDHLWPHLSLHNAANQLYKAAHYARRATGAADCVSLGNEIVTLFGARTVTVDVDAFESSAASALASGEPRGVEAALDA
jgi:DNA-binding SARP family transcriptional activator